MLRTTFRTPTGVLAVTDALAFAPGARGNEIGRPAPHALVRLAEVIVGRVEVEHEFVPRPEYGPVLPALLRTPQGLQAAAGDAPARVRG